MSGDMSSGWVGGPKNFFRVGRSVLWAVLASAFLFGGGHPKILVDVSQEFLRDIDPSGSHLRRNRRICRRQKALQQLRCRVAADCIFKDLLHSLK